MLARACVLARADNWGLKTPAFEKTFIESHLRDVAAAIQNKPVILEEFGKITEDPAQTARNQYFQTAHAVAEDNAKAGGPLMGSLFWHWCAGAVRVFGVGAAEHRWAPALRCACADAPAAC